MHPGLWPALGWLTTAATLASGVVLGDCVLLAGGALLATRTFYAGMDAHAPWDGWRAAIRCGSAGIAFVALGSALLAMIAAAAWGGWEPASNHPGVVLVAAAISAAVDVGRVRRAGVWKDAGLGLAGVAAAMAAVLLAGHGVGYAPCVFAGLAGAVVTWLGWHLLHDVAPALAQADRG